MGAHSEGAFVKKQANAPDRLRALDSNLCPQFISSEHIKKIKFEKRRMFDISFV